MAISSLLRSFARIALDIAVVTAVILLLPGLPPNNVKFEYYSLPSPLELKGELEVNSLLESAVPLLEGRITGPESIATRKGEIYTGLIGGDIVRVKNGLLTVVVKGRPCDGKWREPTCGRPLGMRFDSQGKLIVMDAYYGISRIDVDNGTVEQLINSKEPIEGKPPLIPNDLDVAKDGTIYWTDSSTNALLQDSLLEFLGDPSGRLLKYDPKTKKSTVLLKDLHFANGVQLSQTEDFVLVSETCRSRVIRYFLTGPKQGQHDIFIDRLPGFPDNIRSDRKGGILVSLIAISTSKLPSVNEKLGPFPLVRKFVARILSLLQLAAGSIDSLFPNEYSGKAQYYINHLEPFASLSAKHSIIVQLNEDGKLIGSLQSTRPEVTHFSQITVDENREFAYLGSPYNQAIWRVNVKDSKI